MSQGVCKDAGMTKEVRMWNGEGRKEWEAGKYGNVAMLSGGNGEGLGLGIAAATPYREEKRARAGRSSGLLAKLAGLALGCALAAGKMPAAHWIANISVISRMTIRLNSIYQYAQ